MAEPKVLGWCPGALRPMLSGDGLVVRLRARGGRLAADQLTQIARAAREFGNGIIDLSARANLQLRGVTPQTHGRLIQDLSALGLIDASVEAETRRNILVTPFWQAGDGVSDLAGALAAVLAAPGGPALPAKFGFAIDGGGAGPALRGASADIRLEVQPSGQVLVFADCQSLGAAAEGSARPDRVGAAETALDGPIRAGLFPLQEAPAAAVALAHWFLASGGVREGRGRMAAHLAAGALPPPEFRSHALPAAGTYTPVPGPVPGLGRLIALEFGQITAEVLAALASRTPALRLTPWRMVLSEGEAAPDLPGLIHDPASALLRVTACTGAPGCLQAHQETRALARALAARSPGGLHVSGCAKGCAHPGPSPLTLTATPWGFDLALQARAGGNPVATGLPPDPDTLTESLIRHAASL